MKDVARSNTELISHLKSMKMAKEEVKEEIKTSLIDHLNGTKKVEVSVDEILSGYEELAQTEVEELQTKVTEFLSKFKNETVKKL